MKVKVKMGASIAYYLDDYCEEIECEEVEHDEKQMTEPCATPKRRGGKGKGRAKDNQGGPRAKKRRLTLNKSWLAVTSIGRFTTVTCTS